MKGSHTQNNHQFLFNFNLNQNNRKNMLDKRKISQSYELFNSKRVAKENCRLLLLLIRLQNMFQKVASAQGQGISKKTLPRSLPMVQLPSFKFIFFQKILLFKKKFLFCLRKTVFKITLRFGYIPVFSHTQLKILPF